jgi:hypothetical protein
MNIAERATLSFYEWDYRHRGYYFYDTPVGIEPPYAPYYIPVLKTVTDDSKVPSFFGQIKSLFHKEEQVTSEIPVLLPNVIKQHNPHEGVRLNFPKDHGISLEVFQSFLCMLSHTKSPLSFEIVATGQNIALQLVYSAYDSHVIQSHISTYFTSIITSVIDIEEFPFHDQSEVAILDFGLCEEFIRPINTETSKIDSLTSLFSILNNLHAHESVLFQCIFKGIQSPLAKDIPRAVTNYDGESFFLDAPEMPKLALQKTSSPLFSIIMRLVVQSEQNYKTQNLAKELTQTISLISDSGTNKLIPLSNEGYSLDWHIDNIFQRSSNRTGMILNVNELTTLIHIPNNINVSKLSIEEKKSKKLSYPVIDRKCILGVNTHQGTDNSVYIDTEMRLRHTHIIGATGTGKSTLIANMVLNDIKQGIGSAIFDPHGDIVDDILARIPESHRDSIVIVDPSDADFPIGFNVLEANTELEKIQLSSDLVSAFRQHATSWGDQMTAVLSSAINTFLESSHGGTLIELKRFLIEYPFRNEFLKSVDDATLLYYWKNEYPSIANKIAPLLTRIDTFLRPKIIRYMLVQKSGLDMKYCIEHNKTILIKLSQGLIGEENSYLLGSLLLSKINQVALGRQSQEKGHRTPYYIYIDEFQNFITPSIVSMLSGSRKYGIGLILAHQDLNQIDDAKVLNSVLSNPYTRICFRVGDADSVKLETSFSYFDRKDLQSLAIGEAIIRVGSSLHDGNLRTSPLVSVPHNSEEVRSHIVTQTRSNYCRPRNEVEEMVNALMSTSVIERKEPKQKKEYTHKIESPPVIVEQETITEYIEQVEISKVEITPLEDFETQKDEFIKKTEEVEIIRKHRSIQNFVKTIAVQRGYKAMIEHELSDGKRIDVALIGDALNIGIEISDTNSPVYEVGNIKKCFEHGYKVMIMVSDNEKHLNDIKCLALQEIENELHPKIHFLAPNQIALVLDSLTIEKPQEKPKIRGYRVKTNYVPSNMNDRGSLTDIVLDTMRRK